MAPNIPDTYLWLGLGTPPNKTNPLPQPQPPN